MTVVSRLLSYNLKTSRFAYRPSTGGSTTNRTLAGKAARYWVRINRTGSAFNAYSSADGTTWPQLGATRTIGMGTGTYLGIGVCSDATDQLSTATMNEE